jgi:lipopolysaccharide biosynthesis glycosyltransferase
VLRIFIGYDERQSVAYNVCRYSIERRSSVPVAITPLKLDTLPLKREGLTRFTFSRFLVPWLCNYEGRAIFMDSDFLCLGDVAELAAETDKFGRMFGQPAENKAVYVSKNEHRFEWASMILFDCEANMILTPEYVSTAEKLHHLSWLPEDRVGDLPREWNHLVGYDQPRTDAKAVHFTQGLPIFPETEGSEYAEQWRAEHKAMNSTLPWQETMGSSVHAAMTKDGRRVAKLHKDAIRAD